MPLHHDIKKVIVIGSGPIIIGQGAEFDYAGTQACLALKEEGISVILVNNNPATIMTDHSIVDQVYIEPLTVETLEKIIINEKPDGIIGTLGGQTGLNLTVELYEAGILEKYHVKVLGTSVESIIKGEDRKQFRELMIEINEPIPASKIVHAQEEGLSFAEEIGFPLIIRPAYTLGGEGGGIAGNMDELKRMLANGLELSPIHQVLVEQSIKGWKEIEYEVMRDDNDTCIIVCNMENMDPVGVHTGDSIVVAPSQTLTDKQYQLLRDASLKIIRELKIIGGCNIQFALDPNSDDYFIIEVNPRVSRSSALASKATGYPIARIAAKCALGYHLDEILNPITSNTYAAFEPALDYAVVKLPRFPFDKFTEADHNLGTQMKATGEVMAIDRSFEGALNKGLRSLEMNIFGLNLDVCKKWTQKDINYHLEMATGNRLFAIAEAFRRGSSISDIHEMTLIDEWFLYKILGMIELEALLVQEGWNSLPATLLIKAKEMNFSDAYMGSLLNVSERAVRQKRNELGIKPVYKQVDTCAGEFEAATPYYYSTWKGYDEADRTTKEKILVLGSGPIRIGQGIEFDYCSVHAALALKEMGYEAVVMNNNPETVSTDYSIADRLYFEPLAIEDILHVVEKEQVKGVLVQFGGQTAINVAEELKDEGINVLGTTVESIHKLEERKEFTDLLESLHIPHFKGLSIKDSSVLLQAAEDTGFPIIVRPSYVTGGQSMVICRTPEELNLYTRKAENLNQNKSCPILIDRYVPGTECEMDIISDGKEIIIPGIFEHIEKAGVHSGDSVAVMPPVSLTEEMKKTMCHYAEKIAKELPVIGMMNIQFVIDGDIVRVLEVNPRASRTVPIMTKITNIPMVKWATFVQLGMPIEELHSKSGLLAEPLFYSVKTPVFSAHKLTGADHFLGPEMKSTGEVLGIDFELGNALHKSLFIGKKSPFAGSGEENKTILLSISDHEKASSLQLVKELVEKGFKIAATEGTANLFRQHGIMVKDVIDKDVSPKDVFEQRDISVVINVANSGYDKNNFGYQLRQEATKYAVPCFTSLETAAAAIQFSADGIYEVKPLSQFLSMELSRS
ncbi:carbamoyl-phosphate synthase (glutamine-hydrolyzing) large subunit [Falsibacillus albus]|uniref:Carbamoyl phosphate synthase large chain n=1 Tax=Falsibacillus albus TaxID=2478915 RepID=A0A3L7JZX0_9BACI|nr:carbamoyl-phosphate synthase (glutamine-hydrolyzing) large subunit [Falsibacillus albus]RLQ96080.1 carbamoyl-phosphate synthase (glutamine-hydrolyzing) large subunit [Falsibacillus albus]